MSTQQSATHRRPPGTPGPETGRTAAWPRFLRGVLVLAALLAAGGCSVANNAIRSDFTDFNSIIQFNQTQQMLLNLVRLHYRETPLFLQAGALSASYESQAAGNVLFGTNSDDLTSGGAGLGYTFSSKPTITYTPVEGNAYAQQFISEIKLETLGLLLRSGWKVSKLCDLLVESVVIGSDTIRNEPRSPGFARFTELTRSLQAAQDSRQLGLFVEHGTPVVRAGSESIPVANWQVRSLFDVMFFAAENTETPAEYSGRTKPLVPNDAMRIHASRSRPADAMVWVRHDGYYYSIDNTDIRSKDTFALLMQLSQIQASPAAASPILTLPVR